MAGLPFSVRRPERRIGQTRMMIDERTRTPEWMAACIPRLLVTRSGLRLAHRRPRLMYGTGSAQLPYWLMPVNG